MAAPPSPNIRRTRVYVVTRKRRLTRARTKDGPIGLLTYVRSIHRIPPASAGAPLRSPRGRVDRPASEAPALGARAVPTRALVAGGLVRLHLADRGRRPDSRSEERRVGKECR